MAVLHVKLMFAFTTTQEKKKKKKSFAFITSQHHNFFAMGRKFHYQVENQINRECSCNRSSPSLLLKPRLNQCIGKKRKAHKLQLAANQLKYTRNISLQCEGFINSQFYRIEHAHLFFGESVGTFSVRKIKSQCQRLCSLHLAIPIDS